MAYKIVVVPIYWGHVWDQRKPPDYTHDDVQQALTTIAASHFFDGLADRGVTGVQIEAGTVLKDDPPANQGPNKNSFTDGDVWTRIDKAIANSEVKPPSTWEGNPKTPAKAVYLVCTQPGSQWEMQPGAFGEHTFNQDPIKGFGTCGSDLNGAVATLVHEIIEGGVNEEICDPCGKVEALVGNFRLEGYRTHDLNVCFPFRRSWQRLGSGEFQSNPAVARNTNDDTLEVFAVGTDAVLRHARQKAPDSDWFDWTDVAPGQWQRDPVVLTNKDGRLELFIVGTNTELFHAWQQTPGGTWSTFVSLGGLWPGTPSAAYDAQGIVHVFGLGTDRVIYRTQQRRDATGAITWDKNFGAFSGHWLSDPVVATNADGRLEVFAIGADRQLYHSWQDGSGTWIDPLVSLGGQWLGTPAVGLNYDSATKTGRLEVFGRDVDGGLQHRWQEIPPNPATGGWSAHWEPMGLRPQGDPVVGTNLDYSLEVYALGETTAVERAAQSGPSGAFSGFLPIGGWWPGKPAVARNKSGRLELFARGNDNRMYHLWQENPGVWEVQQPIP